MQEQKRGNGKPADIAEVWVKARPGVRRKTTGEAVRIPQALFHLAPYSLVEMKYIVWQRPNPFKQEECTALKSEI